MSGNIIRTTSGPVTGIEIDDVTGYLGIPYAAAPVGELRWKPPAPPEPWKEPRFMGSFGPACPQANVSLTPDLEEMSEDCLRLNIWTPTRINPEPLPVMVFLHGGGFARGRGSEPMYNTTFLAQKGVVLVTINYRLNALGFLAHPALTAESSLNSSGNYGLMDQLTALIWIRKNISRFGGNPENITLLGQSAGGASVIALMASPLAKGLFQRAIAQSCGYAPKVIRHLTKNQNGLESAESLGLAFAERLGTVSRENPLEEMRAKPWQEIVNAWEKTAQNKQAGTRVSGAWMLNHIIEDGSVLPQAPGKVFKEGKQHAVPFMTGTTADEGSVMPFLMNLFTVEKYFAYLQRCYGEDWEKVLQLYPSADNESVSKVLGRLLGDAFTAGARAAARSTAAIQPKTYLYRFTMNPKLFTFQIPSVNDWQNEFGCYHCAELAYLFNYLDSSNITDEDKKLSEEIAGYWVRFARNGDPNGTGATFWPAYELTGEKHLVLDSPIATGDHLASVASDNIEGLVG